MFGRPIDLGRGRVVRGDEKVGARDQFLLEQEAQDGLPAQLGTKRVRDRVVRARARGQAGEERCLVQLELTRVLVEVHARRHLDPVGAVPEVDRVQVGGEGSVLRPLLLELPGERRLLELAADRALLLRVGVLDELRVIVEPPWTNSLLRTSAHTARSTPRASTPSCSQ